MFRVTPVWISQSVGVTGPEKRLLFNKRDWKFLISPISGIVPVILLLCKLRNVSPAIEAKEEGNELLKLFEDKSSAAREESEPKTDGMLPPNLFEFKLKPTNFVSGPIIEADKLPVSRFLDSTSEVSPVSKEKLSGIELVRLAPVIFREVSAPKLPKEGGRVPPRRTIA